MDWFRKLLGLEVVEQEEEAVPEKLHCIRFMTDRGEQVAILLTSDELETGLTRWVETVNEMPIEMTEDESERGF